MTAEPIGQRILAAYDEMPRGERRLADLLLEDLGVLRHEAAGSLAERAGVSKATAARLFRRLGYVGFKAAQREAREGAAPGGPTGAVPAASDLAGAAPSPSAYLEAEVKHLVRTFELLRSDDIARAVRLLREGEKLWVVGFGDDYPLAHFARALLIKLRPDIRMIPIGGFPIPEELASISAADTVLALAVGRRTQALRNVVGSAGRVGARVILVVDAPVAGDLTHAAVVLRSRAHGPTLFDSMTATVSLLNYLCASLASRIGADATERLRAIEELHAEWGGASEASE
ncbi:MurR/RpiR family transcriptional regulator [Albimonas sp. CAU 1670]|uniref:MurR/RpiR family transcriptional regulator n=1 Tax=Albimonas sp. CAU 1670 TaxID=3032599 RepID=UPI0023DC2425|nr:MurR/RpiR family transcriptional regulator [Albimonas sp. CAU 1670]MDF2233376.1 MurR/RpiR family transcriptional regulator [Albimonas sp. CAU 1670]